MTDLRMLMDGFTLQHVGEVLGDAHSTQRIRAICFETYRRCVADFVFALAFTNTLIVSRHFPRVGDDEPARGLVQDARMTGFFERLDMGPNWTVAETFDNHGFRAELETRLETLRLGLVSQYFKEWMIREIFTSFGCDESLKKIIPSDEYRFSREPEYLKHRELQDKIPRSFVACLRTLVMGVDEVRDLLSKSKATDEAVDEFISRNVLTHLTNGLRYEWQFRNDTTESIIHLPYVTRAVDLGVNSYWSRSAIIPYVLADVVRAPGVTNSAAFVDRLLGLRETDTYRELRKYFVAGFRLKDKNELKRIGREIFNRVEDMDKQAGSEGLLRDDVGIGHSRLGAVPRGVHIALRKIILANQNSVKLVRPRLIEIFPSLGVAEEMRGGHMVTAGANATVIIESSVISGSDNGITIQKRARSKTQEEHMSNDENKGGDRVIAGAGATIINRSTVTNAFNRVKKEHDEGTAELIKKVADIVEKSGDPKAIKLFNAFTDQLQNPQPDKTILESLWQSLMVALPAIGAIAGAVAGISKLFGG